MRGKILPRGRTDVCVRASRRERGIEGGREQAGWRTGGREGGQTCVCVCRRERGIEWGNEGRGGERIGGQGAREREGRRMANG